MRRNVHELPELVRLASEWGVRRLFVQNLSHSFSDTDPSGSYSAIRELAHSEALWAEEDKVDAERIFARARSLAGKLGIELRLPRLEEPPRQRRKPGTPGCHWPFSSAYVTHDGKVQPCCMVMGSDRAVLGDTDRDEFPVIWYGDDYRRFREEVLTDDDPPKVCRGCSLYRGVF
jgi:radical SAM protein with 4Fe4S-binding SPASM domain